MPKASPIQYAFNGGQLGPRLQGRSDLARYRTGCNVMENFIPTYQGPALKRSGFRYVAEVKDSTKKTRLIPFEFSRDEAYILELGEGYMRVYRDSGVVLDGGSPYEIEDGVSGNSLPWLEDELSAISFAQSADVLYLAHGNHPPHKISRTADTAWTSEEIAFNWPAFRDENLDTDQTMVAGVNSGSGVTVTSAGAGSIFSDKNGLFIKISHILEADVSRWSPSVNVQDVDTRISGSAAQIGDQLYYDGRVYALASAPLTATGFDPPTHEAEDGDVRDKNLFWTFYNRGSGYAEITAVSGTTCTVDVIEPFPYRNSTTNASQISHGAAFIGVATPRWSFSAWNSLYGYPRAVSFYEDRLWFAGTEKDPQTFWGSKTGDYENFEVIADQDDSAVSFTLASDKINAIEWMSGEDVLLIGTLGGEFTVDSGNAEAAITPSNIRVRRRSNYGCAQGVRPVFVDSALLFVQRAKSRLHELSYTFQTDRYVAPDLTDMAYDILSSGVVEMSYQSSPLRLLWSALTDGALASLTYIRDQEVIAWAKHTVGGTDAMVESVATIPHPDGDQDQLWNITSRTVNGSTVRYIEFLEKPFAEGGGRADAFFVDSGLTYSGAATSTITGLDHLEGETVQVIGDGIVLSDQTVSSGSITLEQEVTKAQVGLAMPAARLQTMRFDVGIENGTAMGKRKRINRLSVRVSETGDGLEFGSNFETMDEWPVRDTSGEMDVVPLFTGDMDERAMPSGWETEGRVALRHATPLPCTIVSIMPQISSEQV